MPKRLVTRYAMQSAAAAEENHDHGEDEVNPIASTGAFAHFQDGHADRREGVIDQQTAELVGAYITTID
jgi:hypothetical protein